MSNGVPGSAGSRLSREDWLCGALEVLSQEGEAKLRIEALCRSLGVTKGSFYWHFDGRADFLEALVEYWADVFSRSVPEAVEERGGSALERLRCVFDIVITRDRARYDAAFDAWAAHEPGIAAKVRAVYAERFAYVSSLFRKLGFRGVELETRTAALISFMRSYRVVSGASDSKGSAARRAAQFEFFVRP